MPFNYSIGDKPTGSQLRRRYLPQGVGGAAGPTTPAAGSMKTPGAGLSRATIGGPPPPTGMPWDNKGGQTGFTPPGPPGGGAPWNKPVVPGGAGGSVVHGVTDRPVTRPMGGMFGGFSPSQLTQQNGQWGGVGPGGNFQALGQSALARWLASQGGGPTVAVDTGGGPPSGPIMAPPQQGYVTPERWADWTNSGLNNWFTNGEQAAGRPVDYNAFNEWFRQFGRSFDPAGWDRLYGPVTMSVGG